MSCKMCVRTVLLLLFILIIKFSFLFLFAFCPPRLLSGQQLTGEFRDGRIYSGIGCCRLTSGGVYEGLVQFGRIAGVGKYTSTSGMVFEGESLDPSAEDKVRAKDEAEGDGGDGKTNKKVAMGDAW